MNVLAVLVVIAVLVLCYFIHHISVQLRNDLEELDKILKEEKKKNFLPFGDNK